MLSTQILEIIIYTMIVLLYIAYYYQLYLGTKMAKLLLICEVGYRAISSVFVISGGGFTSYWELLHYVPTLLSITLFFSKGVISKILFIILSSLIIIIAVNNMYLVVLGLV